MIFYRTWTSPKKRESFQECFFKCYLPIALRKFSHPEWPILRFDPALRSPHVMQVKTFIPHASPEALRIHLPDIEVCKKHIRTTLMSVHTKKRHRTTDVYALYIWWLVHVARVVAEMTGISKDRYPRSRSGSINCPPVILRIRLSAPTI